MRNKSVLSDTSWVHSLSLTRIAWRRIHRNSAAADMRRPRCIVLYEATVLSYTNPMQVTLIPQAEEALRQQLSRSPGRQAEEIVEEALTEMGRRVVGSSAAKTGMKPEDFRAWLQELRQGAKPAPHLVDETFPREMIYQDHD